MSNDPTPDINVVGATAFVIARMRAMEKDQPRPLFDDPYASWFGHEMAEGAARQLIASHPAAWAAIRYRTCLFDGFVSDGIAAGARQVVSLGAGLAMRAHVFATEGVGFFEVDQPGVLEYKHAVLRARGVTPCRSLACDYLEVDVPDGLANVGLDPSLPTLFVWEGNTMYLPFEAIFPFLTRLAEGIRSLRIAFDYFSADLANRDFQSEEEAEVVARVEAAMGTSFSAGFPDLSVFERRTPLRVADSGLILALHRDYDPDVEIEGLEEIQEAYGYCVLETRPPS